jgi:hypothetical protein
VKKKDIERKQEVLKGRENKKASTTRQSVLAKTIKKKFHMAKREVSTKTREEKKILTRHRKDYN